LRLKPRKKKPRFLENIGHLQQVELPVDEIIGVPDNVGRESRRSKAGRMAKTKGGVFERKVGKLFEPWWDSKFFRTPMSGGSQLKFDYNLAGDICTPAKDFPFHVECKNQECLGKFHNFLVSAKSAVWKWWQQTTDECPSDQIPILVFTKNHIPIFVMMDIEYWIALNTLAPYKGAEFEYDSSVRTNGTVTITLKTFMVVSKEEHLHAAEKYWETKASTTS